ncbi:hypothetical protein SDC9_191106 [bioreactor metagenome]|uniref:Uncharacterized protein n=1 Tax=bioreactor metagenome TaxID=1076179 RepID=A0A645HY67_9ZZZZ
MERRRDLLHFRYVMAGFPGFSGPFTLFFHGRGKTRFIHRHFLFFRDIHRQVQWESVGIVQ